MNEPSQHAPNQQPTSLFRYWFGLTGEVTRDDYLAAGLGLSVLKYAVEATVIGFYANRRFTPLDYLNPLLSYRMEFFQPPAPSWLIWIALVWTLPFLWIAVSMSVRRALNCGWSPTSGLWVLFPGTNLFLMAALSVKGTHAPRTLPPYFKKPEDPIEQLSSIKSAMLGLAAAFVIGMPMLLLCV